MKQKMLTQTLIICFFLIAAGCDKHSKPTKKGNEEEPPPVYSEKIDGGRLPKFSDATLQIEWYKETPQTVRRKVFNDKTWPRDIVEGVSVSGTREKEKDVYVRWEYVGPSGIRGGDIYIFLLQDNEKPGNNWTKTIVFKGDELVVNESNDVKIILDRKPLSEQDTPTPGGTDRGR